MQQYGDKILGEGKMETEILWHMKKNEKGGKSQK